MEFEFHKTKDCTWPCQVYGNVQDHNKKTARKSIRAVKIGAKTES